MKKVQILGTGCPKCKALYENAKKAVEESSIEAEVEKIDDIKEIVKFNVLSIPGIVIDGEVKSTGKVLSPEEISNILRS